MEQWHENLDKMKQIALDIVKEDSNVVEVKVKKDEISIKRKPKDAGDEIEEQRNDEARKIADKIPDSYLLENVKSPEHKNTA